MFNWSNICDEILKVSSSFSSFWMWVKSVTVNCLSFWKINNDALSFFNLLDRLIVFESFTLSVMILSLDSASVFWCFNALLSLNFSCNFLLYKRFLELFLVSAWECCQVKSELNVMIWIQCRMLWWSCVEVWQSDSILKDMFFTLINKWLYLATLLT